MNAPDTKIDEIVVAFNEKWKSGNINEPEEMLDLVRQTLITFKENIEKDCVKRIYLAEIESGKTYALPLEDIEQKTASEIAKIANCRIVLFPRSSFNLNLTPPPQKTL